MRLFSGFFFTRTPLVIPDLFTENLFFEVLFPIDLPPTPKEKQFLVKNLSGGE